METKSDLRKKSKLIRKAADISSVSERAVSKIAALPEFREAKHVMLYYPTEFEIDLRGLMKYPGKSFYLPRVEGNNLCMCPYSPGDELKLSGFNIYEPCCEPVSPACSDLIIVPALAADKSGYRLGYGGGFYDRFLARDGLKNVKTICPVLKELYFERLPHEDFDVAVNLVIPVVQRLVR